MRAVRAARAGAMQGGCSPWAAPALPTRAQGCGDMLPHCQGGCCDTEQEAKPEDHGIYTNTLCQEEVMGMPSGHFPGQEVSYMF